MEANNNSNHEVRVADVMSSPAVALDASTCVHDVLTLAAERGIHHFPILRGGTLTGFVCTCDLEHAALSDTLDNWMRLQIITVTPETTTRRAGALMNAHGVGSVVVTNGQEIAGILTRADLERHGTDQPSGERARCCTCRRQHRLHATSSGRYKCADCSRPDAARLEIGFGD